VKCPPHFRNRTNVNLNSCCKDVSWTLTETRPIKIVALLGSQKLLYGTVFTQVHHLQLHTIRISICITPPFLPGLTCNQLYYPKVPEQNFTHISLFLPECYVPPPFINSSITLTILG
jgi:hypothetical protein